MIAWAGADRIVFVRIANDGGEMAGQVVGEVIQRFRDADDLKLSPREMLILVVLAETCNSRDCEARLSTREVAKRVRVQSKTVVRKALHHLAEAGLIRMTQPAHGARPAYWRILPDVENSGHLRSAQDGGHRTSAQGGHLRSAHGGHPKGDHPLPRLPRLPREGLQRPPGKEDLSAAATLAPLRSPDGFAPLAPRPEAHGPNGAARSGRSGHDIEEAIMRRSGNPEEDRIAEEAYRRAREMNQYVRGSPAERAGILAMLRDEVRGERGRRPESEPASGTTS